VTRKIGVRVVAFVVRFTLLRRERWLILPKRRIMQRNLYSGRTLFDHFLLTLLLSLMLLLLSEALGELSVLL
jgi:hypothetical protein